MKKLSILLFAFVALMSFNACTSDDDIVFVAQPDPEGIEFTNTFSEVYLLTSSTSNNLAERFVWNEVDFDAPTTITYELQGSTDADFTVVDVLGSTGGNNLGVTVGQMLSMAEDAGLDNDPATEEPNTGDLYFRVRAFAGDGEGNALEEYSEVRNLSVMLPESGEEEEEAMRELYFVGDATAAGWSPDNNNTPMFRDAENEDVYYFQGRFAGGGDVEGFKLVEIPGQWQPQWGGTDGVLSVNAGDSDDPAAFKVAADAYYSLMVDVDNMTYTWEEIDESDATVYNEIGIIGDATADGWDSDQDMTQSDFDPHIWYVNDIELTDGEIKFRADNDWAVNWGDETPISGQGVQEGSNIPATAGTYDIWFNTLDGRYILIPQAAE
ncbi:SusF/SusE family outer membrane protein [Salegentibacter flavus]|uniref:SusE outer membrane protein n=1 Tax=Salegentibacter flavus TaxID=287099 RepID=A0A1I5ABU1_9FLAO|nr:SusF/SusE family outer membrane protein [Salegentibacter flavus]SFN59868.1 SusE outer membrane protein [Salegentibacter flavus]